MAQADQVMAELLHQIRQARNDTAVEIVANLMEPADEGGTPVDTGWARANWIPSLTADDSPVGSPGDAGSAAGAQQRAIAEVVKYDGPDPLWVNNNVPYISQLNDGYSKKAAAGFVDFAVDRAEVAMQRLHDGKQIDVTGAGTRQAGGVAAENLATAYSPFGDG